MRFARTYVPAFFSLLLVFPAFSQQTAPSTSSSPQALALLQKSLAALTGGQSITDITLSGTARRIAGSDDETGTATFKALAETGSRIDLTLPGGNRSEIRNVAGGNLTGSWSGPDGVSNSVALHNLLSEPSWSFPLFVVARRLSDPSYIATYLGHETHNGRAVEHVTVSQTSSFPDSPDGPSFAHLTQVEFFLDSTTLLPAAIAFNIHPDKNALVDLPTEIRFSDYRYVTGAQIPFHFQKLLNNGLILDFQAQTAALNAGLSASLFNIQ